MAYELRIFSGANRIDFSNHNFGVEIRLDNGLVLAATFFTLRNVKSLMKKYESTAEYARGLYFWASDMIIVESLCEDSFRQTIDDLRISGEIRYIAWFCHVLAFWLSSVAF